MSGFSDILDSLGSVPLTALMAGIVFGVLFVTYRIATMVNVTLNSLGGRLVKSYDGLQKVITDGTEVDLDQTEKIEAIRDGQKKIAEDVGEIKIGLPKVIENMLQIKYEISELHHFTANLSSDQANSSAALDNMCVIVTDMQKDLKGLEKNIKRNAKASKELPHASASPAVLPTATSSD